MRPPLLELDDPRRGEYLAGRPTAPAQRPVHGHATFLQRVDADGTTWCAICDDDQEARARVVLDHLRHGPLTLWQIVTELGCRGREVLPLVASLHRRGLIARLGDVRRLSEPVPCCGAQGLWVLPDEVAGLVAARELVS